MTTPALEAAKPALAPAKPALLVDAHAVGNSGLGRYTRELACRLAARDDFRAVYIAGDPAEVSGWHPALRVLPFRHARHSPRVPWGWAAIEAEVAGPRVSWFPHWDGAWTAQPAVTTIHDLIHLAEPGVAGALKGAVARAWIGRMVQGSRALVAVSAHTARAVEQAFPAARGKLHVVPNGVAQAFFGAAPAGDAPVAGPYLLTVGNKRVHKRFDTAIRAFAQLAAERPTLQLVMIGNRDAHTAELRRLAESLGVAARVHDVAALGDAALDRAYAGAEALLVTSRDEGFGLIAIEAMAAGCPVVAVDRGPFPEVIGDAGVLVPYDDPAAMADALRQLDRPALIARGRARAARYTWDAAADLLAPILRAAAR